MPRHSAREPNRNPVAITNPFHVMVGHMTSCGDGVRPRDLAEQVARRSYGKLVAFLAARTRDLAAAEDALSEAFAAVLANWPQNGCPQNPEAWLMTVARRKFLDSARSRVREVEADNLEETSEAIAAAVDSAEIPDRRLGLMFACTHPAIDRAIRAPLMLQAILGLDAERIASAFLISPSTMSQPLPRTTVPKQPCSCRSIRSPQGAVNSSRR